MKRYFILVTLLVIVACNKNKHNIENNSYQIISLVYAEVLHGLDFQLDLPPPPPTFIEGKGQDYMDSLDLAYVQLIKKIASDSFKNKNKKVQRRIAIAPELHAPKDFSSFQNGRFKNLFEEFIVVDRFEKVNLSKIHTTKNETLMYFNDSLTTKNTAAFENFDLLISFSKITFNEDFGKAIIVCSGSVSARAGASVMYFLEKTKNGRWYIRDTIELSIS